MLATDSWNNIVITRTLLIFALYVSSIGLVFYQQWFLQVYAYPLFLTAFNQLIKFTFAFSCRTGYVWYTGKSRISLSWNDQFRYMAALGLFGGMHLALSNWSLELNTVSLFTVSKSTSIIFILVFATMLGLEKITWKIIIIVCMISSGLALFTYKSAQLIIVGFIVAVAAACMSALRWTYCQYIFQKSNIGIENPIDMMYYVDMWVFVIILPLALLVEGVRLYQQLQDGTILYLCLLWLGSAVISFVMESTKYIVLRLTSSLTVSVIAILKEIATLIIAYLFMGDQMSFINFVGMVLCISGVTAHAVFKYRTAKRRYYEEIINTKLTSSISSC